LETISIADFMTAIPARLFGPESNPVIIFEIFLKNSIPTKNEIPCIKRLKNMSGNC